MAQAHTASNPAGRGESPGTRSTPVGSRTFGANTVQEIANRPRGAEHVNGYLPLMLRDDVAFPFRFGVALPPDPDGQTPFVPQSGPGRVVAPFGQLARHSEPAQECSC